MQDFKSFINSGWKNYLSEDDLSYPAHITGATDPNLSTTDNLQATPKPSYNGANSLPYDDSIEDQRGIDQAPGTAAAFQIDHMGQSWFHGGRVAINPNTGERMFQYLPENPDPYNQDHTIWANEAGQVIGSNYPGKSFTKANTSVIGKPQNPQFKKPE